MKGLTIPSRPSVILVLQEELGRDDPDINRIKQTIAKDVALAAAMLKAVNSAAFALSRKVSSVNEAIDVIGLRNVTSIATAMALRQQMGSGNPSLERFWDSAEKVARLCSYLARQLRAISAEDAYSYGLFHDCGIAVLMTRFNNYRDVLKSANQSGDQRFTAIEESMLGTNHAVVGYFLARSWALNDSLCRAILLHHELDVFSGEAKDDIPCLNLVGIGHFAEHIHHVMTRSSPDLEWAKQQDAVQHHFGIDTEELVNLVDGAEAYITRR